mmetsp:Transcript_66308/g.158628  ORF Transcript_66308/g.158628 Transcript_66308/m.158628 type:complete len:217 (-) Transcript_66308:39-689(-)
MAVAKPGAVGMDPAAYSMAVMDRTKYTLNSSSESMVRTSLDKAPKGLPAVGFGVTKAKLMQAAFADPATVVVHAGSPDRPEAHVLAAEGEPSAMGALDIGEDVANVLLIVELKQGLSSAQSYMKALLARKQRNPAVTCVAESAKASKDPSSIASTLEALHAAGATQVQLGTFWSTDGRWSCPLPGRVAESEAPDSDLAESFALPRLQDDEALLLAA